MDISILYKIFLNCTCVTTDSRNCPKGSLFFALKGANFDGNKFAAKALELGSTYAIVDEAEYAGSTNSHIILVDNCLKTLQQLAHYHREQMGTKMIGITGTNGKTTTKELISTVLKEAHNVLYTEGNLNNSIGVPLTLLRLTAYHDIAVVEMGASHPGDIKELVDIADPDYGIITNVGKAHLQGFGSFENIIKTKGELYDYLRSKGDSTIFINRDNRYLMKIAGKLNPIYYGKKDGLYVNGKIIECSPFLIFSWKAGKDEESYTVHTKLIGDYNFDNALAAVTIGRFFGVDPMRINSALEAYSPGNSRSQLKETEHNSLIIDAYNANPTSMNASLANYEKMKLEHKIVILGDMKELGKTSMQEHQNIVDSLSQNLFDRIILVGEEFGKTKLPKGSFEHYNSVEDVISQLQKQPITGASVLIKGSNSMHLNKLVDEL
jgi:UDP-N-acetylmuramoyl-tripeptide--D-alanyl-D-alanine ligase